MILDVRPRLQVVSGSCLLPFLITWLFFGPVARGANALSNPASPDAPEGCPCVGTVGNVNCDYRDEITLGDVTLLIDHLFISGVRLPNLEEANIDGDPAGEIGLVDVMMLIDHLFISGAPLPDCPKPYNNPPETHLYGLQDLMPYINGTAPHNFATGVRMTWAADDLIDHPYDNPTFFFEYRVFGPYTDADYAGLLSQFKRAVFLTNDGRLFQLGYGYTFVHCDTVWLPGGIRDVLCDTILVDTLEQANELGRLDSLLDVDDPRFESSPVYNRIAAHSGNGSNVWTSKTADSLYDLFAGRPVDTTTLANFVVWLRARDPLDSTVVDPTPAFQGIRVFEPRHERDILVVDWGLAAIENRVRNSSGRAFWTSAIDNWIVSSGHPELSFDAASDIVHVAGYQNSRTQCLAALLKYKVVIMYQDGAGAGIWSTAGDLQVAAYSALLVGSSMWVAARVPVGNHSFPGTFAVDNTSAIYQYAFGIQKYVFPGWGSWLFDSEHYGLPRTEDFVGAYSTDTLRWPNVEIDTALLRTRYIWEGCVPPPSCYTDPDCAPEACFPFYPYTDTTFGLLGALPQVGWTEPTADAEVMYTYKSLYGSEHPIAPNLSFDSLPVMVRVDRDDFRTVHSCFTPMALATSDAQQLVSSVLSWLYDGWLQVDDGRPSGSAPQRGK